jgi:hypothetical protein
MMGVLKLRYQKFKFAEGKGGALSIKTSEFEKFNPRVLGLGNLAAPGQYVDALAAVFDLEGFTSFCNQSDPHLATPEFLSEFLEWLFNKISTYPRLSEKQLETLSASPKRGNVILWCSVPFFSKFLGDGILFIWDTSYANENREIGNVVLGLKRHCR